MTTQRWYKAQNCERNWWQSRTDAMDLDFYAAVARDLRRELGGILTLEPHTRILEIGSGAAGILTHLGESNERHAVDPLENFYALVERFRAYRDPAVHYRTGSGEKLAFPADYSHLVIIDNVLDHCAEPDRVLDEIQRVLKPEGVVYLRQNTYHPWGRLVRWSMERFQIDQGHPHTISKGYLRRRFEKLGLEARRFEHGGYWATWSAEIRSPRTLDRVKALLMATRDRTLYILQKPALAASAHF